MDYKEIMKKVVEQANNGEDCLIVVDGKTKVGMSTLAMEIREIYRKALRTKEVQKR